MNSDNQMDELFKDRLRNYPSSVPSDMWVRIMEQKKRDRVFWLFFRLLAIGILALGVTGGYYLLIQKKSIAAIPQGNVKVNPSPITADTLKSGLAKSSSGQDQMRIPHIDAAHTKTDQKRKEKKYYSVESERTNRSKSENPDPLPFGNANRNLSAPKDSMVTKENKLENNKDSLYKKPLVKTPAADSSQNKEVKKPEPEKNLHNRKWFLDLYVSPDYPIIHPQEEYEQSKLSYSIGIKLNRSLGKHFSVKTGIQFSQVNIGGDDSLTQGNTLHLMRLDLPVLAGYSLGNDNLRTTFNGGLVLNLYSWLSGTYLQDFFKTNTGLSVYLGVNFDTKINERISVFAEPYYRYQLTPMTVSSISNLKFIDVVGINIGARYFFKK